MNDYKLEHLFSYTGMLAAPEVIGPLPEGLRVNFYSTGGEITGPRVRGKLRPVGGDWVTVRRDGVALLDVRTTFETDDEVPILVMYQGVLDFGVDGYEKFANGDLPSIARIRISPRFSTSHPEYAWMNRVHCLGIGAYRVETNSATYDVYAVQ